MSYQVLARKYRPQQFDDVIGQEHITTTLKNALGSQRLHHAYLFTGARGIGKTTIARILAKALNCESRQGPEPCNACCACEAITSGRSLDVQEIDGASNTSVDDVREIRERVKFLPSSGKYKIYIIDEVHMLSTSAFNALLKTLEEPPPHVVFIFATTEAHKIPATILSRCQRYDFRRIPVKRIVEALAAIAAAEGVKVAEDALALIAREASGSMRDAQSLFDQAIAFSGGSVSHEAIKGMLGFLDRQILFEALAAVIEKQPQKALEALDEVFAQGADLVRFAADLLECFRHLLILAECEDRASSIDLPQDEVVRLKELQAKVGRDELQQMFSLWYSGVETISRSSFPKILFEVLLLRLCRIAPVQPIGELLEKVEAWLHCSQAVEKGPAARQPEEAGRVVLEQYVARPADEGNKADGLFQQPAQDWPSLQRWLVEKEPRVASLLQHGKLIALEAGTITMSFDNPLYADMLTEHDRKKQIEGLFQQFFAQKMALLVEQPAVTGKSAPKVRAEKVQAQTKELLKSAAVREAAEILGARVHDVKIADEPAE